MSTSTTTDLLPETSFADLKGDARIQAARDEIDAAIERLAAPEAWKAYLDTYAQFHQYSFGNTILALVQFPQATRLASYKRWQELGRKVISGPGSAIYVWAPMTRKVATVDAKTGEAGEASKVWGFRLVPVFDIAQTEGEPLPEVPVKYAPVAGDVDPAVITELIAKITDRGFRVQFTELSGSTEGQTEFISKQVLVDAQASPAEQARILAHELAHIALDHGTRIDEYHSGHNGHRGDMEVEAESVAYTVARYYGIPTEDASFTYIAGWAHGDAAKVKATANAVSKAVKSLLDDAA